MKERNPLHLQVCSILHISIGLGLCKQSTAMWNNFELFSWAWLSCGKNSVLINLISHQGWKALKSIRCHHNLLTVGFSKVDRFHCSLPVRCWQFEALYSQSIEGKIIELIQCVENWRTISEFIKLGLMIFFYIKLHFSFYSNILSKHIKAY